MSSGAPEAVLSARFPSPRHRAAKARRLSPPRANDRSRYGYGDRPRRGVGRCARSPRSHADRNTTTFSRHDACFVPALTLTSFVPAAFSAAGSSEKIPAELKEVLNEVGLTGKCRSRHSHSRHASRHAAQPRPPLSADRTPCRRAEPAC